MNQVQKVVLAAVAALDLGSSNLPSLGAAEIAGGGQVKKTPVESLVDAELVTKKISALRRDFETQILTYKKLDTSSPASVISQALKIAERGFGSNLIAGRKVEFYLGDTNKEVGLGLYPVLNLLPGHIMVSSIHYQRALGDAEIAISGLSDREIERAYSYEFPTINSAATTGERREYYVNYLAANSMAEAVMLAILKDTVATNLNVPVSINFREIFFQEEYLSQRAYATGQLLDDSRSALARVVSASNDRHLPLRLELRDLSEIYPLWNEVIRNVSPTERLSNPKWQRFPSVFTNANRTRDEFILNWRAYENERVALQFTPIRSMSKKLVLFDYQRASELAQEIEILQFLLELKKDTKAIFALRQHVEADTLFNFND